MRRLRKSGVIREAAAAIAAAAVAFAAPALADAPAFLPLQGTLADADGSPVEGDVALHLGIFGSDTGGTALWTEDQTVTAAGGMMTAYLGAVAPLDLGLFRDNGVLYLEIGVGDSAPLPRMQLATTPYAGFAQYCGDAGTLAGAAIGDLAPAAHDHDGRYYTETELATPGSASVDWGNLASVPAGFADGIDDDTTYTAGLGLQLAGTRFSAEPTYLEERARAACYDTEGELRATLDAIYATPAAVDPLARAVCYDTPAELRAALDAVYAAASHGHAWTDLTGVPAGFADGTDNVGFTSSLVSMVGPGLGDYRNNSGVAPAGTWWNIPGRSLTFTKQSAGSRLKVTYQDTLGTYGQYYDGCEWRILLDGVQIAFFSDADMDGPFGWRMSNAAHMAWASGTAGSHTVVVQNRGNRGAWGGGTSECLQGWNTAGSFLSVEEIP